MKIMVLGCGPSGMVAIHAAASLGHEVIMVSSLTLPSRLHGCQYLHEPIPGYEDVEKTTVSYNLIGTPEQYRGKVYGEDWKGKVSPEDFIGQHDAWDIRETYRRLWSDYIKSGEIRKVSWRIHGDIKFSRIFSPDKIISTIPANSLCVDREHKFKSMKIFARGTVEPDLPVVDSITCNGTDDMSWYRVSNVFGYQTSEWPSEGYHDPEAVEVSKPISTNCTCHPEIIRAGRYGEWSKGILVHQVFNKVSDSINAS